MFANGKIKPQHFVLKKCDINLYFPKHKLAVEVNENAHLDRNEYEDKKKRKIKKRNKSEKNQGLVNVYLINQDLWNKNINYKGNNADLLFSV